MRKYTKIVPKNSSIHAMFQSCRHLILAGQLSWTQMTSPNATVTQSRVSWAASPHLIEKQQSPTCQHSEESAKNVNGRIVFYLSPGPYRSIPGLYRVLTGLVPGSPSSYSSSLPFSPCPHRVHTTSSPAGTPGCRPNRLDDVIKPPFIS